MEKAAVSRQGRELIPFTLPIEKGKGKRNIYCPFESRCVDHAARENWPAFNCEKCPQYLDPESGAVPEPDVIETAAPAACLEEEVMEKKKVCKKCGKEKSLTEDFHVNRALKDGRESICKSCKSEKAKKRWRDKKKETKPNVPIPPPPAGKTVPPVTADDPPAEIPLVLDLTDYPYVMEHLHEAAKTQIRTIQLQAIAYIVAGLQRDGYGKETS